MLFGQQTEEKEYYDSIIESVNGSEVSSRCSPGFCA